MNNFQQWMQNFISQSRDFFTSLSMAKRIAFGLTAATVVGLLIAVIALNSKDSYEYIFTNLAPADKSEIIGYFDANNIGSYISDDKGIKVPQDQVLPLRMRLSQEGLPTNGTVGWEQFDKQDFAKTEFEQKINKRRAIEGELARTINTIPGILSSRVHITSPEKSIFVREEKERTAAVYLRLKKGFELDNSQVKGIQHIVAHSVEGMKKQNVSLHDSSGKLLTKATEEDVETAKSKERLIYTRQIESKYEDKIIQIISRIVGPEKVDAKVNVEIDFNKEIQKISDVDPDDVAVESKQTKGMKMAGSGLNPTGIPGAKSNVPSEQEGTNAGGGFDQNSSNEEETINYQISKKMIERTLPQGNIKRITASVIVDGKQIHSRDGTLSEFIPRTNDEMTKISDLVKSAIGFQDSRDVVTVKNIMFQLNPYQLEQINYSNEENKEYLMTIAKSLTIAIALVLFFTFLVRPYLRWLSYDPNKKQTTKNVEEFRPELESSSLQTVHQTEEVPFDKLSPHEQVLFLAKNEPARTTEALRLLLNPHQMNH